MSSAQLIHLINQQAHRTLTSKEIGQTVDFLYALDYFNLSAQTYGRQYLVMMVEMKMIESYVLRKKKPLIDIKHFYILVQGKVDKSGYNTGAEINVERDGHINTLEDCIFLRLSVSSKSKNFKKLRQFQHQKLQKISLLETRLTHDEQKQLLKRKLKEIQIFRKLPKADFQELAYGCTLKSLFKGKISHEFEKKLVSLIYIVEGQIKVSLPLQVEQDNHNLDTYMEKYLVKQVGKKSKRQVNANYGKGDWIGMDEYFQGIPSKTLGIIMSVEAKVLYIPVDLFDRLFNIKTNYATFSKIRYMMQIKANLLEKSSTVQQKKEAELLRWSQDKASMSPQLKKKISKYQFDENIDDEIKNPQIYKDSWEKKQPNIPTKVVHIVKSQLSQNEQNHLSNLSTQNKLSTVQRVNLFPEEYSQEFIYPNEMRQIQEAEYKKNINLMMYMSPKYHRKACKNSKSSLKNPLNIEGEITLQKSFFSMSKKVSENFALCSTFYRNYLGKGDEQVNLNFKTINSLQPSRKDLLLRRKSQIHDQINNKPSGSFVLPGLRSRPTIKDFQPMKPQKGSTLDLSQHLMKHKYHIDSNNELNLQSNESYQTIFIGSSSKISNLRDYSKTLFVNREKLEKEVKIENKSKNSLKRKTSVLSIQ